MIEVTNELRSFLFNKFEQSQTKEETLWMSINNITNLRYRVPSTNFIQLKEKVKEHWTPKIKSNLCKPFLSLVREIVFTHIVNTIN